MDLARQGSRSRSQRRRLAGPRETRGSKPRRLSLFRQQGNRREKRRRPERQDPKFQAIELQPIDRRKPLSLQDSPSRVGDTKPSRAVDLRKGLNKDAPVSRSVQRAGVISSRPI